MTIVILDQVYYMIFEVHSSTKTATSFSYSSIVFACSLCSCPQTNQVPTQPRKARMWTLLCMSTHSSEGNTCCLVRSHEGKTTLQAAESQGPSSVSWGVPLDPITRENLRIIKGNFMMSPAHLGLWNIVKKVSILVTCN